jgi:hypothetical protein
MAWTISPPLEEPFELVPGTGNPADQQSGDEGCIRMKDGVAFKGPMDKKTYTVKCTMDIPGIDPIVRTTTLDIQVDQAVQPDDGGGFWLLGEGVVG